MGNNTNPAKGQRPKKTIIRNSAGKELYEVKRWPMGEIVLTDLSGPAGSDCAMIFESADIAAAIGAALMGRNYIKEAGDK